jgi:uncharacterized membrane protein SpoIIM required for sporulation
VRAALDLDAFVAARSQRWARLEELVGFAEDRSERDLGRERVLELVQLYRLSCTDLNRLRSLTANPELLGRVNQLVGRAYRFIYRAQPPRPRAAAVRRFLFEEVPATFRREERWVLSAAGAMLAGALIGFFAVLSHPANVHALIPPQFFAESARERVERIEKNPERIDSARKAADFGAFLYTHNIQVSFLGFSLAALTMVGAWLLLFYNGMLLGAIAAQYLLDDVGTFFVAWVGPHGALELPAIVFGCAAGLRLGSALLLPGEVGRAEALRRALPSVWRMMLTTALLLVLAGIIEGSFSQLSQNSVSYGVKIAVAFALFAAMVGWLFVFRRGEIGRGSP